MMSPGSEYNATVDEYNYTEYYIYDYYGNETLGVYSFYTAPQYVLLSLQCLAIIVGNLFVLWAIRLADSGRQTRMNFFILHLAVADLMVGVAVSFVDLLTKLTIDWHAGNVMCKLILFIQTTASYSSTFILVSLSIDRYDAVARPMNFSRSGMQARILIGMAWGASIVFALPMLVIYKEETIDSKTQCWLHLSEKWHWQLFVCVVAASIFFIPTLVIASCYTAIIYVIWSKGRVRRSPDAVQRGQGSSQNRLTISDSRHITANSIIPQARIRTIKMTLIIVIVFILCWSPYFVYNLMYVFEKIPQNNSLSTFIQTAAPLNSAANPVIYGIFSTRICRNLKRLTTNPCLRKIFCRCTEANGGSNSYRHKFRTKQYPKYYNHLHNHPTGNSHTDPTMSTLDASRRVTSSRHSSRAIQLVVNSNETGSAIASTATASTTMTVIGESSTSATCHVNVKHHGVNTNEPLDSSYNFLSALSEEERARSNEESVIGEKMTSSPPSLKKNAKASASKRVTLEVAVYDVGHITSSPSSSSSESNVNSRRIISPSPSSSSSSSAEQERPRRTEENYPRLLVDNKVVDDIGTSMAEESIESVEILTDDHEYRDLDGCDDYDDESLKTVDNNIMEKSTTLLLDENGKGCDGEDDENASFKSIASRRPSGLPVVRKTLTANESMILSHVTGRLPIPSITK